MSVEKFEKEAKQFFTWLNVLVTESKSAIEQATKATKSGADPEDCASNAELCLRRIKKRMKDVDACYDEMLNTLGFATGYAETQYISLP